jgi:small-conductance mechanosensitive channel
MITALLSALVVLGLPTLYLAWRSWEFRKFLAGAFFVSAGTQFYLYLAKVSVPLLGTNVVLTPEISGLRSIIHFILFVLCLYFGFIKEQKASGK